MSKYFGDYLDSSTINIPFNTVDATGDSVTITNFAVGDVEIHKDAGTTQRASDAGITISIDFDGVTGNHFIHIDTSDDTDVGFYSIGSIYDVRIEGVTVDTRTINAWIGKFSIEAQTVGSIKASVANIGSGGSGSINFQMTDDNVDGDLTYGGSFVGVQTTGTYVNTQIDPSDYHNFDDTGNDISITYYTNIGGNTQGVNVLFQGYMNGNNDTCDVEIYDFIGAGWDTLYTIQGTASSNNIVEPAMKLLSKHTGTGAELGDVYIRFSSLGKTNQSLYIGTLYIEAVNTSLSIGYADGAYWVDSAGIAGSEIGVNGTADKPCPWANAIVMNATMSLDRFHIKNGNTVTLTDSIASFTLIGEAWDLDLNGKIIDKASVYGAEVVGIGVNTVGHGDFYDCHIGACTTGEMHFYRCGFGYASGTYTAGGNGQYIMHNCYSMVPGSDSPSFDFDTNISATTGINNRKWAGGAIWTLDANCTLSHEVLAGGGTTITTNGADVEIRGITRSLTLNVASALDSTIQFVGTTGMITVSGVVTANTTTINLYGVSSDITDTTSGAGTVTITDETISTLNTTEAIVRGTVVSATVSSVVLDTAAAAVAGTYDPARICITCGTGVGQSRNIFQYDADRTCWINRNWKTNPDNTSKYTIFSDAGDTHVNEGRAQAGGNSSITLNVLADSNNDVYIGQLVFLVAGTGMDQCGYITAYNGTTKIATIDSTWAGDNPDGTTVYAMLPAHVQSKSDYSLAADQAVNMTKIAGAAVSTATAQIGVNVVSEDNIAFGATKLASLESECNDALVALKLDRLVAVADADDVVDNSIIAKLSSTTGDWSTFISSTDALQSLRDRGDAAWVSGSGATAAQVWDYLTSAITTSGSIGKFITDIDNINQPISGAVIWNYTVTEEVSGDPIPDATVLAQIGSNFIQSRVTNASGIASFILEPDTYDFYSLKAGQNFDNPDTEVVS